VSGVVGLGVPGIVNDGADRGVRDLRRAAGPRGIPLEAVETKMVESMAPESTRVILNSELLGDLLVLGPIGGPEDDLGP